ncbi:phosphotriesterase [Oceanobacillus longus]|uniref:Phosphotriesterase n=1 Tax=Oceanobacillus longus TaxID=930120 RepID=A0ABV8GZ92_9BACI
MAKMVNTVLGQVAADELGKTLMHEHIFFGYPGFDGNSLYQKDRTELVKLGVEAVNVAKSQGVQTIVDATPSDSGRYPDLLREVSEKSGVHIICATGYYYEGEGAPAYFKFKQGLGIAEDELYELFMGEITNGIGKTGIKPGVIKLASGKDSISEYEELFFRMGARAQKVTGIPIITHTQEGTMGPEQAKLLTSEGVDPKKIVIGHMDGNTDIHYQLQTLEYGVYVGFDRIGLQGLVGAPMDSERIIVLLGLINSAYANQLTLSHDKVNVWLGKAPEFPDDLAELTRNWEMDHLFKNIIPELEKHGVSKATIDSILVDTPKNIFNV